MSYQRHERKMLRRISCYLDSTSKSRMACLNTLRPRQKGRHFPDDISKCIFLNENVWIPIEISLTFVPKGSINNNPALFQIMAWRRPGDKPLSEPMMISSLTHICVTRPQWVKVQDTSWPSQKFSTKYLYTKLYKVCLLGSSSEYQYHNNMNVANLWHHREFVNWYPMYLDIFIAPNYVTPCTVYGHTDIIHSGAVWSR